MTVPWMSNVPVAAPGRRVLVVDDDPDIRELVGLYLKGGGYAVALASGGANALEIVGERGAPDLAVLDVSMPDMDGIALLGALRAVPGLEHLPVIFLSARVTPEEIARGVELGAAYLTKPFVGSALLGLIGRLLTAQPAEW